MDIESDESERWEDFFGSSTDLAPSVIGYYDRLSTSIDTFKSVSHSSNHTTIPITSTHITSSNPIVVNSSPSVKTTTSSTSNRIGQQSIPKPPRNGFKLSPNVQRIISHSSDTVDQLGSNDEPHRCHKIHKRTGKLKPQINIPLSRNTCKLTQSGTELVDTFDSNSSYSSCDSLDQNCSLSRKMLSEMDDAEKTPTNPNNSFLFDHCSTPIKNERESKDSEVSHPVNCTDDGGKTLRPAKIKKIVKRLQSPIRSEQLSIKHNGQSINGKIPVDTTDDEMELFHDCRTGTAPIEAINLNVRLKPQRTDYDNNLNGFANLSIVEQTNSLFKIAAKTDYKIMPSNIDSNILEQSNPSSVKLSPKLLPKEKTKPVRKLSFKSVDNISQIGQKSILIIPDIARLKHRPLSASSICSTSSTSSSGSEHLTGKLGISYLASVESLADQSENESGQVNGTLTLCERACLEIIDSERSYVEDLGQVIKGYLEDWKERACLKVNDQKTLFSNIQNVYDFNFMLLKQLVNAAGDPVKIAQCFINLKDRFDAYTIYCTSYPEAISLLTSLLQASHTNALLTSTQKMLKHTLPLGSYLLKPVQRILKYHLLLGNLRKHCEAADVAEAHELMKEVAQNIDQVKKTLEQHSRVRELSGILDGWLGPELTVLGELKHEGLLMENNKPRIVLLFQTMLIITKPKEDSRLQFKTYIHCKHLMLIEHLPGEPTSFNVIPYNDPHPTQIKLTARNRDQKRLWAQHIKQVMLEHFDIPNRAKELVFKLGDEEDRTTDKNTWKWGTHSSTTPEYLERRNQYRRSEMRYRTKKQRKTMTSSLSLEAFNKSELSVHNKSLDDSSLLTPRLGCDHCTDECKCKIVKDQLYDTLTKGRSRSLSETRSILAKTGSQQKINNKDDSSKYLTLGRPKTKVAEVKMYNTKTLPKRIANLKKQRSKTMKETSKFYMDLPETTTKYEVLRITESSENLHEEKPEEQLVEDVEEPVKPDERVSMSKKDVEIISDLLKEHKEFDRILKKPPKKRSFDNGKVVPSQEPMLALPVQPIDIEEINSAVGAEINCSDEINKMTETNEPLYESLLRNVHVPYKFSPILSRSKSQQYDKFKRIKPIEKERPESDYVTLAYTESGELERVDGHLVCKREPDIELSNSDTNINYNKLTETDGSFEHNDSIDNNPSARIDETESQSVCEPLVYAENITVISRVRKSLDNISFRSGRLSERQDSSSDVSFMSNIIHKQGSESLGSRIAHLDYADPRTLFTVANQGQQLINKAAFKEKERDSVFSLTSSNDSVNDPKTIQSKSDHSDSYYEQSVEDSLENDEYRDSAIYSDDNERRIENIYEAILIQPENNRKPMLSPPPPIPAKPVFRTIRHPHDKLRTSNSWVLQQIKNFDK